MILEEGTDPEIDVQVTPSSYLVGNCHLHVPNVQDYILVNDWI